MKSEEAALDRIAGCLHREVKVEFDPEAAKGLAASEIRKRWPRFHGPCPTCGELIIAYASALHYTFGDW